MNISKHNFLNDELNQFVINFNNMEITTEPITNLLLACIYDDNPIIEYYRDKYFSSEVYYNYVSASSIVTGNFLQSQFGEHHFMFFSRLKHFNYILNYGQSQFIVSANSKELITNTISTSNISENLNTIKDVVGFSLRFQQMLTIYGLSSDVPERFQGFFKRMISHPEIHQILTANYEDELNKIVTHE